jgi:hypothetical protein
MEHGTGTRRASVQNGPVWRAWRRTDQVPSGRIFPWRAVRALPGSALRNTVRSRRWMIDDTKVVDE